MNTKARWSAGFFAPVGTPESENVLAGRNDASTAQEHRNGPCVSALGTVLLRVALAYLLQL
jgi:hypothetical protein